MIPYAGCYRTPGRHEKSTLCGAIGICYRHMPFAVFDSPTPSGTGTQSNTQKDDPLPYKQMLQIAPEITVLAEILP